MNTGAKSGSMRRTKGVRAEREVARVFEQAGADVRALEGQGDHLVVRGLDGTRDLHLEVKRQERLRLDEWSHQAESEAPKDAIPIVVYRRSREPWRASILLDDLIGLLG